MIDIHAHILPGIDDGADVLADSINEKLYDTFQDTVLSDDCTLLEDYIDQLKERILP